VRRVERITSRAPCTPAKGGERMRRLIVIVAVVLCLPSCTRYLSEDAGSRGAASRSYDTPPGVGVIGLSLDQRSGDGAESVLLVDRTVPDGPAALANIRPGDRIIEIDGQPTRGMTIGEAARLIRGPADAAVELRVDSPQGSRLITLVRVTPASLWGDRPAPCGRCRHHACCPHGARCPHCGDCPHGADCPRCAGRPEPCKKSPPGPRSWPPSKPGHPYQ
jgi:hypothetical protein